MTIKRDITRKALKYVDSPDILILTGARQAGKTTIMKQIRSQLEKEGRACYWLDLEDIEYLGMANQTPKNLFKIFNLDLDKQNYVFVDEVQYLDNPSNFLKYLHDEYAGRIKLIASGSSAFYLDTKFSDSLAGRKRIFHVRTLSFREFLRFRQEDTLARADLGRLSLQEKERVSLYFREYMLYGGYPRVVLAPREEKREILRELAYSYIKKDILEANISKSDAFYKLFRVLAGQTGGLINTSELADTLDLSKTSIDNYLLIMRKSFHISLVKPFHGNIRKELTKMPKVYFLDLGLRNFFLDWQDSFAARPDKGQLLENAVYRQLLEKREPDEINFWRTITRKEVDFVSGREAWEVKLNPRKAKKRDYQSFMDSYPDIQLKIASIDSDPDTNQDLPVVNAWGI